MTEQEIFELTKLIKEVSSHPDADEHIATILKIASGGAKDDKKNFLKKREKD